MTIIYFILILGVTVFIHELGHFLFAKRYGVYVYEFSIGMGPKVIKWNRKNDETSYSIRLFPIGGFVSLAGEEIEEDKTIPAEKQLFNKKWYQKFFITIAGVLFNFILAIILLFFVALKTGVAPYKPYIATIESEYDISNTNFQVGDQILEYNGKKITSIDRLLIEMTVENGSEGEFLVKHKNGEKENITLHATLVEEEGQKSYKFGFSLDNQKTYGISESVQYAFTKTGSLIEQMFLTIKYLITGKLKLNNLAGPVGIYNVVDSVSQTGLINLLYLTAYICINVGFLNLLPIPAFDGGRALFLIIEKIRGKKISPRTENIIHSIGFYLLMLLMILVTYNDIIRIFNK